MSTHKPGLFNVTEAHGRMWTEGGSFARAIAAAWTVADRNNGRILEDAFRDLFIRYGAMEACPRTLALDRPGVPMGQPCQYAWTGSMPCTGRLRCGLCGGFKGALG